MKISSQIDMRPAELAGISAGALPGGVGAPAKGPAPSLTVTKAPAGVGLADGTDGISPAALEAALRRDDDLGKFVNRVLGA